MGRGQAFPEKYGVGIDHRRLGAIAILLFDALFLAAFLAPAKAHITGAAHEQSPAAVFEPLNTPFEAAEDNASAKQAFYPYSVIPGGASSANELRNAVEHDATVRAHYADFAVANTRVERLGKTQAFYVSYRIGNCPQYPVARQTVLCISASEALPGEKA